MKFLVTYSGSTWAPVHHRARFDVQAPQVRASGLPSAAVKTTMGFPSRAACSRASRMLVSQRISRQGLSPGRGRMATISRSRSQCGIAGTVVGDSAVLEMPGRAKIESKINGTAFPSLGRRCCAPKAR